MSAQKPWKDILFSEVVDEKTFLEKIVDEKTSKKCTLVVRRLDVLSIDFTSI
jgi:hypothetical protein